MKRMESVQMEVMVGGDWKCRAVINGLFTFGMTILAVPAGQIIGGVLAVGAIALEAGNACGDYI